MKVKSIKRRRPFRLASLILFIIVVASLIFFGINKHNPDRKQKDKTPKYDNFHLLGFDYTHFDKGKELFTIKAEEIIHKKMKVGPLTISPFKEIEMIKVMMEINQDRYIARNEQYVRNDSSLEKRSDIFPLSLSNILRETAISQRLERLGLISRVVIKGLDLIILRKGQKQFTIAANKVTIVPVSQKVMFQNGFSLISRNGEQLIARNAQWKNKRKSFFIKGTYELRDEKGITTGSWAFFIIDRFGKIKKV